MRTSLTLTTAIIALLLLTGPATQAEVTDSTFYGFTVKHEYTVKTNPDSLYKFITQDIGLWWSPLHTFSGNAANLIIQPKANGCFCERLANGGSVRHMTVVFAEPGKVLRMTGGIGPLQEMPVEGVMTIVLKPSDAETVLTVTYAVSGYVKGGLASLAPVVDRVIGEQFAALKRFAEVRP